MSEPEGAVEPIAIVGIGCRYAGVRGPEQFWDLVRSGTCAVREPPQHRIDLGYDIDHFYDPRPKTPGKVASRLAGFVDHPELFDAAAFGLAPRDAVSMEPQQRLTIEVTWDALEDAGIAPESLQGERVAVIVGHMAEDYSRERIAVLGEEAVNRSLDVFSVGGMSRAVLSGRISFLLGVTGPSLTLDTACSSSLIATHLACQSLWQGESKLALAGGVNIFLTPEGNIALSRSGMLAIDGRCKAFDAGADGFVRAEGAGMVVLRPLRDALEAGDRIYALIRGTGTSTDGRDGGHMMAPGRFGQAQAMRDAYARAGISPSRVDYVEAHGTGTPIGDPVEIRALADVMDPGRPADRPLLVASVKGNIGHAESASGVAGLIKAALAIQRREIPAQLHFNEPSPAIPWDEIAVRVNDRCIPWPHDGPAIVGVNSFGISGTNAHVVLESAPEPIVSEPATDDPAPVLIPITAHTPRALEQMAERYRDRLRGPDPPSLADLAHTLGRRRSHRSERLAVVARTRAGLADELDRFIQGAASGVVHSGSTRPGAAPAVVFVFPGQGGQWPGMGRELLRSEPFFRECIHAWDGAYAQHVDWSLERVLADPAYAHRLATLDVLQPTVIALEIALAELWMHRGVRPALVLGQSMGEIAAAYTAGCLGRDDVARLACHRGLQVARAAGRGAMAVVSLPSAAVQTHLLDYQGRVEVSGSTSPSTTVVSGDRDAVTRLVAELDGQGVFARRMNVDFASHCFHMEPLLDDFGQAIHGLEPRAGEIPFYSTVEGKRLHGEDLGCDYWVKNLRAPVLFDRAVEEALGAGGEIFLEVSPHPTLGRAITEISDAAARPATHLASLRRDQDDSQSLQGSLGGLFTRGVVLDFAAIAPGGRLVDTPLYAYQRERHWFGSRTRAQTRRPRHPLLATHLQSSVDDRLEHWEASLDLDRLPWLASHRLDARATAPAALFIDVALAAARDRWPDAAMCVGEIELGEPLALAEGGRRVLQSVLRRARTGGGELRVLSRSADDQSARWRLHARCVLRPAEPNRPETASLQELERRCSRALDPDAHHRRLASGGLVLKGPLRAVKQMQAGEREVLAKLALPRPSETEWYVHPCHPALLAAGMQIAAAVAGDVGGGGGPLTPLAMDEIRLDDWAGGEVWCHARLRDRRGAGATELVEADLTFLSSDGKVLGHVRRMRARQRACAAESGAGAEGERLCGVEWRPIEAPVRSASDPTGAWIVAAEDDESGQRVVDALRDAGFEAWLCTPDEEPRVLARRVQPRSDAALGIVVLDWIAAAEDDAELASRSQGWLAELIGTLCDPGRPAGPRWWVTHDSFAWAGTDASAGRHAGVRAGARSEAGTGPARRWGTPPVDSCGDARWIRMDLGAAEPAQACAALASCLGAATQESQLLLRNGSWMAARLARLDARPDPTSAAPAAAPADRRDFVARVVDTEAFDSTLLEECPPPSPGRDEVVVEVEAAGLTFLDVLSALGVGADIDGAAVGLGREMAGRIVARGEAVRGLDVGDAVLGFASDAVARRVVTSADLVTPIPDGLDFVQAAGLPLAHCAALHALRDVARVSEGDSVLIHSATGGVGLAAIAIARRLGARVFATAGDESRRERLRALGVEHVACSRSAGASDEIMQATQGAGIDVILDTSQRIEADAGLGLLAPGGRYVDLNPLRPTQSATASDPHFPRLGENRAFLTLDFEALLTSRPERVAGLLAEINATLASGGLAPSATTVFPVDQVGRALRYLAQARHVGKVVVSLEHAESVPIRSTARRPSRLRADGRYVVSGLRGESASRLADWMLEQGAGSVEIESDAGLTGCARRKVGSGHPLRGVVHVEPSTRDRDPVVLREIELELEALAAGAGLDFLLLVSPSHPWLHGPSGRTATAARLDLAALAGRDRALGRSTRHLAIAGEWSDDELLAGLDRTLGHAFEHPSVISLADDFARWMGDESDQPLLRELQLAAEDEADGPANLDALAALPRQARLARLREIVRDGLAGVLGLGAAERSKLDERASLEDLGLDSLMTLELHLGLVNDLGFELPPASLNEARCVADLAVVMADEVDRRQLGVSA